MQVEFNINGTIRLSSVETVKKVRLKLKDTETVKERLIKARVRGKVALHQIAAIDDKQWLRVDSKQFNGAFWIEVQ